MLRWVKTGFEHDTEVYEEIATLIRGSGIYSFYGNRMVAVCKRLSFASLILAVSYYCIILCYR